MALAAISKSIYESLPNLRLDSPINMLSKAATVAIPIIALSAANYIQGADAFTSCIFCAVCLIAPNPGCILPCTICFVTLPTPANVIV